MADVKWIKITTDIFNNRKIKQIEALPDGYAIIVIWVKLLCLAGNTNDSGFVYFTKEIPYTEQMLATQFCMSLPQIKLAMKTFEQFAMIEVVDDMFKISNWEKYQNIEGMERIREQNRLRKQRQREKEKLLLNDSHVMSRDSHAIDIDIDIDKEKERICVAEAPHKTNKKFIKPSLEEVKAYCAERHNNVDAERFLNYYESNGWKVGKNPMKDWKAAVRTWEQSDKAAVQNSKAKGFNNFPQREYDMNNLEARLLRGG